MADTGGQEKTETATPRRREEARQDGNVPRSQEINTVSMLLCAMLMMWMFAPRTFEMLSSLQVKYHSSLHEREISESTTPALFWDIAKDILLIVYPFTLSFILTALIIGLAQVGFLFTTKSMQPKPSRLSPLEGVKRIFSARGAMELAKSLLKIALIAPLMYYTIISEIPILAGLADEPVKAILVHLGLLALRVVSKALLILLFLALLDFAFQRFQHERDLRMTQQEVKEELKRTQGDPQIKARIRQVQREVARRRMMAKVPEAEVVVTNPTEYAIALAYKQGEHAAPMVVAMGQGIIAARIKEIARTANVPIYEDRPLAQILYKLCEIGQMIPPELYEGVASALAFVYRLRESQKKKSKKAAGF